MDKKLLQNKRSFLFFFCLIWIIVGFGFTYFRFGFIPPDGVQIISALLGFILVGFSSGLLVYHYRSHPHRKVFFSFYVLSMPCIYYFTIVGPLMLSILPFTAIPGVLMYFLLIPIAMGIWGFLATMIIFTVIQSLLNLLYKLKVLFKRVKRKS